MSESGRVGAIAAGLALAFFCVFLIGIWSGNTDNQYGASYAETNQQAYPYSEEEAARFGVAPGSRKTYQEICGYPTGREEADLCQQWRSANASRESAKWSGWGFLLSALGATGAAITVFYAIRTFRLQDATTRAELRAYISTRCGGVIEFSEARFAASVLFDNDGQTPAYKVRSIVLAYLVNNPIMDFDTAYVIGNLREQALVARTNSLARGRGHSSVTEFRPENEFLARRDAILKGEGQIAVAGRIEYDDTFGAHHVTNFFHLYPLGRWKADDAFYHHQGNDTD